MPVQDTGLFERPTVEQAHRSPGGDGDPGTCGIQRHRGGTRDHGQLTEAIARLRTPDPHDSVRPDGGGDLAVAAERCVAQLGSVPQDPSAVGSAREQLGTPVPGADE